MESKSFRIDRYDAQTDVIWGIYEGDDDVHVIPETRELEILLPHVRERECPCHPDIDSEGEEYKSVVMHNMIH